jgi:hypothetical protein
MTDDQASAQSGTIMVDEEDGNDPLFEEDKDMQNVLAYYEKRFKEDIGIMLGVVEHEDIEVDLIVGTDSNQVLGMRVLQSVPAEDIDASENDVPAANDAEQVPASDGESSSEDEGEDDEVDDDNELIDVIIYDLTRVDDPKAKVKGEPALKFLVGAPIYEDDSDDEEKPAEKQEPKKAPTGGDEAVEKEKYWLEISLYWKIDEDECADYTGAILHYINKPQTKIVFLPNPDLC